MDHTSNKSYIDSPSRIEKVKGINEGIEFGREDLNFLSAMASQICGTASALITLMGKNKQYIKSTHNLDMVQRSFPREFTFCNYTIQAPNEVMTVADARLDHRFKNSPFVTAAKPVIFYAGAPLVGFDNMVIGTLCAIDETPKHLSQTQIKNLKLLASQVMKTLELDYVNKKLQATNRALIKQKINQNQLTDELKIATYEWDIEQNRFVFNEVWADITGYAPSEYASLGFDHWESLIHPDDRATIQRALNEHFINPEKSFRQQFRLKKKNEDYIWLQVKGKVIKHDGQGNPLLMLGMFQDITRDKKNERDRKYRQVLLDALYRLSPIGIALNDFDTGAYVEVNSKLLEPIGYTQEEFLSLSYWDVTPIEYSDQEQKQLQLLHVNGFYGPYEKEYLRKNGTKYPVLLNGVLVKDADGKKMIWSFVEDISLRKRDDSLRKEQYERIQGLLKVAQSQNDRLKNFAHIVSHNLRSHSSGISMLLRLFADSFPEMKQDELYTHLNAASGNLESTIKDLNEVVDINTADNSNFKKINLKSAVVKIADSCHSLFLTEDVSLELEVSEDDSVFGLNSYLESVILNLITNGIRYKSESRKSFVRIKSAKNDLTKMVVLSIEDNGLGIDLNRFGSRLFKMYHTFHDHKDSKGIGLFLTKNQVEAMGGTITVESAVDSGTKFIVNLPYEKN
ncbi:MAG: PAS domain-containing protein [Leeuwenhoekiella sp.]